MSVDQIPTRQPPRRSDDAKLVRYEDYIESKIQSTRWMVKAVDLATALVTLVASVLAFLLVDRGGRALDRAGRIFGCGANDAVRRVGDRRRLLSSIGAFGRCWCARSIRSTRRGRSSKAARR